MSNLIPDRYREVSVTTVDIPLTDAHSALGDTRHCNRHVPASLEREVRKAGDGLNTGWG